MCLWRLRIDLPGDPPDITIVTTVLVGYPARLLSMSMEHDRETATGQFVVDLPHDEGLGPMLSALHDISSRVFIEQEKSCLASRPAAATSAGTRIRSLRDRPAPVGLAGLSRSRSAVRPG
jgi:hypothetical protein